jgi:hypothetical protein
MEDIVYLVVVNLGTADHSITPLRLSGGAYVDDLGDNYIRESEIKFDEPVGTEGRIYYATSSLETAEDVATGIWMVRKMLRNWIDS